MYRECLQRGQAGHRAASKLFQLMLSMGLLDAALELALTHPTAISSSFAGSYNIGLLHYFQKDFGSSLEIFTKLVKSTEKSKFHFRASLMMGQILEKTGRSELALACYAKIQRELKSPSL